MTPIKRPLAAAGAGALLALALTACGGDAPTDASTRDFCDAVQDIFETNSEVQGDEPTEDEWEEIQDAYDDLGEVGTPDDIGDSERNGFEVVVDTITGLDYDEAKKVFASEDDSIPGVSEEEDKDADAFFEYVEEKCADALEPGGATSDPVEPPPSDLGTPDPSEVPTEVPSDFPTDLSPEELESLQSELEKLTESPAE